MKMQRGVVMAAVAFLGLAAAEARAQVVYTQYPAGYGVLPTFYNYNVRPAAYGPYYGGGLSYIQPTGMSPVGYTPLLSSATYYPAYTGYYPSYTSLGAYRGPVLNPGPVTTYSYPVYTSPLLYRPY